MIAAMKRMGAPFIYTMSAHPPDDLDSGIFYISPGDPQPILERGETTVRVEERARSRSPIKRYRTVSAKHAPQPSSKHRKVKAVDEVVQTTEISDESDRLPGEIFHMSMEECSDEGD